MKTTIGIGTFPIVIHTKESATLDMSSDAVGTISVPGEGVAVTITGGNRYKYGNFAVKREVIVSLTQGTCDVRVSTDGMMNGVWEPLTPPYTLSAADDQKCYYLTTAGTVTVPGGLSPRPTVAFQAPSSGNASITGTLNGSSQTLTRSRASNLAGFVLAPYVESDGYGLSGS